MLVGARKARVLATMIGLNIAAGQLHAAQATLLELMSWCAYGARDIGTRLD